MKGWGGLIVVIILSAVGLGLYLLDIHARPSSGWFWAYGLGCAFMSAYSLNQARDAWPLDGQPVSFGAVEAVVMAGAYAAAAFVLIALGAMGGLAK